MRLQSDLAIADSDHQEQRLGGVRAIPAIEQLAAVFDGDNIPVVAVKLDSLVHSPSEGQAVHIQLTVVVATHCAGLIHIDGVRPAKATLAVEAGSVVANCGYGYRIIGTAFAAQQTAVQEGNKAIDFFGFIGNDRSRCNGNGTDLALVTGSNGDLSNAFCNCGHQAGSVDSSNCLIAGCKGNCLICFCGLYTNLDLVGLAYLDRCSSKIDLNVLNLDACRLSRLCGQPLAASHQADAHAHYQ